MTEIFERMRDEMSGALKRIGLGLLALQVFAGNVLAQDATPVPATPSPVSDAVATHATGLGSLPQDLTPWGMYQSADIVVKAVLLGLLFASIVTWTVGLAKGFELLSAQRRLRATLGDLSKVRSLRDALAHLGSGSGGPIPAFLKAAAVERELSDDLRGEGIKERIASRLERIEAAARQRIARGTGILATIGATAPFVGLFGTVWGIMNSFIGISRAQTTNLAIVAPGIAEALLATAFGLVAAIPAVVIYNAFARATGAYRGLLGDAAAETLRLVSRDLDREEIQQGAEPAAKVRLAKAAE